ELVMFRSDKGPGKRSKEPSPRVDAGGASVVPPEIASRIQRVGDREFNVERGAISEIIEKQAELMKFVRVTPFQDNGKVVGLQLLGIRPDTILGVLGFEPGDRLETINGFDMTNPESAMSAFARLRTADHLVVRVNRRGQDLNLDYNVK